MARRAAAARQDFVMEPNTPLEEAVLLDQANTALDLTDILEALQGYDQGTIKGVLYRKPTNGLGKYEWIEELTPPFDFASMFTEMKDRFGGGEFQLRIFAGGRIRKNADFSIAKEKNPIIPPAKNDNDGLMGMMFQMMMRQSEEAARQRSEDARDRAAAAERQTTMIIGLASTALPLLMGGKDKTSEVMAALAPYMNRPDTGMKDALETLTLAKGLFKEDGGDKGSFDADDLVGSALKIAGPMAGALGRAFTGRSREAAENPAPQTEAAPQTLMLPGGSPSEALRVGGSRFPILDLIRDDVLFMFARGHDPERAAEVVYDTFENSQLSESALNELVAAFAVSPDPLGELAAEGIDLRSRPEWAEQFFQSLVAIHTDAQRDDDDSGRQGRRDADAAHDADTGAAGVAANAGAQSGGEAHD